MSFCMEVSSYALQQNTMRTRMHLQGASRMSTFIPFDNDTLLHQSTEEEDDINMLFMSNETVIFKNGKGINWEVTYLGPNLSDGILKGHRLIYLVVAFFATPGQWQDFIPFQSKGKLDPKTVYSRAAWPICF